MYEPKYKEESPPSEGSSKHSESGLYTVRLFDMFDGWIDLSPKGISWQNAVRYWLRETSGGTKKIRYSDGDYYDIFPAETKMLMTPEYLGR